MRRLDRAIRIAVLLTVTVSCSGPVVKEGVGVRHEVSRIDLTRVRFHRPPLKPVSPRDLDESPRNGEIRNCVAPGVLWEGILARHASITDCLNSLKGGKVDYRLVKQAALELVFEAGDGTDPSCLARELPVIPLPREIYFRAETVSDGTLETLSLSFEPLTRAWFDWDWLTPRPRIRFQVPPARELKDARDLEAWLLIWMFSVFYPEQGTIRAAYVPDFDARSCFDKQRNDRSPGVFWP